MAQTPAPRRKRLGFKNKTLCLQQGFHLRDAFRRANKTEGTVARGEHNYSYFSNIAPPAKVAYTGK